MSDWILVDKDPPLATITINRPETRNAINYQMWGELSNLFLDLDEDKDYRVIIITGAGREAFSAGADINDFKKYRSDSNLGRQYNDSVNGLLRTVSTLETPTISMIRGFAAGGGCELAVATDLRMASDDVRMGIPVAKLGITIGHIEMQGLINLVGKSNALYILYSGRLVNGSEALSMGLLNQVIDAATLETETYKLAKDIASLAPLSHAINKRTLNQVLSKPDLNTLSEAEADLPLFQFDTRDYQEGYTAFLEKRSPYFIGE